MKKSGQVLMMAWMSQESLQRTLALGETVFWSRSRQELWHKGATSGNVQRSVICAWIAMATRCWCWWTRLDRPAIQAKLAAFFVQLNKKLQFHNNG